MKFSIKDFFSKSVVHWKLWIYSYLLKKFLIENFIICAVTPFLKKWSFRFSLKTFQKFPQLANFSYKQLNFRVQSRLSIWLVLSALIVGRFESETKTDTLPTPLTRRVVKWVATCTRISKVSSSSLITSYLQR